MRRPAKMYVTTRLMRDRRRVYRSIRRKLGKDDYRKDLIEVCVAEGKEDVVKRGFVVY